jgi:hypothetical protein
MKEEKQKNAMRQRTAFLSTMCVCLLCDVARAQRTTGIKEIKIIPWRDAGRCALLFPFRFSNRQVDDDALICILRRRRRRRRERDSLSPCPGLARPDSPPSRYDGERRPFYLILLTYTISPCLPSAIALLCLILFFVSFVSSLCILCWLPFYLANINTITQIRFQS